jgi:hypothetical protein
MKISKLMLAIGIFAFYMSFASVRAQDNPAQAAAREALMKQMNGLQAPEPQSPSAQPTVPVVAAKPAGPAPPMEPVAPAAPGILMLQTNAVVAPPAIPPVSVTVPAPIPIIAPGLPISMTKEQRLQALLARYKADQVTPEQYHTQRAAILAEP